MRTVACQVASEIRRRRCRCDLAPVAPGVSEGRIAEREWVVLPAPFVVEEELVDSGVENVVEERQANEGTP